MLKFSGAGCIGFAGATILLAASLAACTTIEGTNALSDVGTFEREVGKETLKGLGIIPRESKEPIETPRSLLVLPKEGVEISPPAESPDYAMLPEDADKPKIDSTGLSEEELKRIRKIIVFDGRADSGRKLTNAEIAQLTRNIEAGRLRLVLNAEAPLWVPDDRYFTTGVGGQDAVCLTADGDLVPLDDPACPPEIREQFLKQQQ
jgi:hypothetical protein